MAGFRQKLGALIAGKKSFINNDDVDRLPGQNMYSVQIPDLAAVWGQYTDSNLSVLYHEVAEIFCPVHLIATAVANGNYQLKKKSDDSVVNDNSYMNFFLSTPNPLQNWQELVYQKTAYELVCGKSYLYANNPDTLKLNYRNISTLINLAADNVQIQTEPMIKILSATTIEDLILSFIVPDGTSGLVHIAPAKVMYTKHASLYAYDLNIRGRSPLLSAQKAITNLIKVYEARNVIYSHRGALVILSSAQTDKGGNIPMTPEEKMDVQKDFKKYGISKDKTPFLITDQALNVTPIGMSIKELEPFTETKADAEAIFAVYNVPRELMPSDEGATFENQNHAEKRLYESVAIPYAKSMVQSLTNFLKLNEAGLYLDVDFSHIKVLQENLKEKSGVDWRNNETYRVQFSYGLVTLNDWRIAFNMKPVTGKPIYDKLLFEMTPEQLTEVENIIKISGATKTSGGGTSASGGGDANSASDAPSNG